MKLTGDCDTYDLFAPARVASVHRADLVAKPLAFRPIQYLGNKLRTLPLIEAVAKPFLRRTAGACDLFSGSSVVSQAFASWGAAVTAIDSQLACRTIAAAMLGVARREREAIDGVSARRIASRKPDEALERPWLIAATREASAVKRRDVETLVEIYESLPLIWKHKQPTDPVFGSRPFGDVALFTSIFAGTYFGIRQALDLDQIRIAIEIARQDGMIGDWEHQAYLTALLTAASAAVHSAGKHFAQPLTAARSLRGSVFRSERLLRDRSINIVLTFIKASDVIGRTARPSGEDHTAIQATIEESSDHIASARPTLIYADPPYTAQQYSRFYHALDTLIAYRIPYMHHGERITKGLYPVERFKSKFCSKSHAPSAFHKLLKISSSSGAPLLISYSLSAEGSDGNDRMISLPDLVDICRAYYGHRLVEVIPLNHAYRQFNSRQRSNQLRQDPEMLIVCGR
jgi:adenine-specific DNA-methyltransferase